MAASRGFNPYRVVRRDGGLTPLEGILSAAIKKIGLSDGMERNRILDREVWQRAVGDEIAAVTRPQKLGHRTLYVNVSNSTCLQHLGFLHKTLLQNVNRELAGDPIKKLHFSLGEVEWKDASESGPPAAKGPSSEPSPDEIGEIEELTVSLKSDEIREGLKKVLRKASAYKPAKKEDLQGDGNGKTI